MSKNKLLIKGAAILTIAGLCSKVLGFLYRIFLSNLIGAEGMGTFQLIMPILGFCVSLCSGGIQIAVSRFVAESKSRAQCLGILKASLLMSGALALIVATALHLLSDYVAIIFLHDEEYSKMLEYVAYTVPMAAFHSCIIGYYFGVKNTTIPATAQILEQLFKFLTLFVISLVFAGNNQMLTAQQAVLSVFLSELAGTLFLFAAIYTTRLSIISENSKLAVSRTIHNKLCSTLHDVKQLFSVAYILTINKIMLTLLQSVEAIIVPIVLVESGLTRADSLSIYGILTGMALPVISFPAALITSISMIIMPMVAEANVSKNEVSMKHSANISTYVSCIVGIFFLGIFMYFGDFVGVTIFNQPLAGEYIKNLAWLCPFMYLSITFGSILHGLGKTTTTFIHNLISLIIRIGFLWFLVPQIGITGYFWGILISTLATPFLHAYSISKCIEFNFSAINYIIKPALWLIVSIGAGMFAENILDIIFSSINFKGFLAQMVSFVLCGGFITLVFSGFLFMSVIRKQ